jgi:hypothetical protein
MRIDGDWHTTDARRFPSWLTPARTVVAGLLMIALSGVAGPADAAEGVCAHVADCSFEARRDIDGDGRRDAIATVDHGDGTHTVRVLTADGRLLRKRVRPEYWAIGDILYGIAKIDGAAGHELVVGYTHGAHALFFKVLTYRRGQLVVADAPGRGWVWAVDGAYSFSVGVWRRVREGRTFVTLRSASRDADGSGFTGRDALFRWRNGAWAHIRSRQRHYAHDDDAYAIGGWHVRGLPKYL